MYLRNFLPIYIRSPHGAPIKTIYKYSPLCWLCTLFRFWPRPIVLSWVPHQLGSSTVYCPNSWIFLSLEGYIPNPFIFWSALSFLTLPSLLLVLNSIGCVDFFSQFGSIFLQTFPISNFSSLFPATSLVPLLVLRVPIPIFVPPLKCRMSRYYSPSISEKWYNLSDSSGLAKMSTTCRSIRT